MHEFELLADPTRQRIVELLAHQELSVVLLTAKLGPGFPISRSAVSHQMRVLRDAGFVEAREWGSERRYRLAWNAMDRLDAAVEHLWTIWEKLHRAGRRGLRGRTRAEIEPRASGDDWFSLLPD